MNKTIASLALLKTNWDNATNRKDFLDIFVPFVVTLIKRKNYRSIDVNTVCKDFVSEYGLVVPYHPMLAILTRTMKAGYIEKRPTEKYVPVRNMIVTGDFTDSALQQERKYEYVLEQFLEYCQAKHGETLTKEEAESVFVSFLKDHDLDILFINQDFNTLLPNASATISQRYLINSFVEHVNESNPDIFAFVVDISVGHILANTFLYSGFDKYQDGLSTCSFYLDIGFLFNLMGIDGEEKQTAYSDFVQLILEQNARLFLFRHTYDEFMGILEGCLQWAENPYFDLLKASRAAKYFVEKSFSVSDIEHFILKTSGKLSDLKIQLLDAPAPMKETNYQIGETKLTDIIVGIYKKNTPAFDETEKESTIYKDVKSISAIYKLRGGNKPNKLHEAGHIFVTTNSSLALASRLYEIKSTKEIYFFIPAALTDVFVGTLIWLQSPSKIVEINKKRLIASCFAALEPTKPMIKKLTETAERLKLEGTITEEDVSLLKQSRVARNLLQEETLGDPNRFTDKTVIEILGEIRADISKEEGEKFDQERAAFKTKTSELLSEIEKQRQHTETVEQKHSLTMNELEAVQSEKANIEGNIDKVADRIVSILTGVFYVFSIILAIAVSIFQFYPKLIGNRPILNLFLIVIAVLLSLAGLFAAFIKSVGNRMRLFLKKRIVQFLKGRK